MVEQLEKIEFRTDDGENVFFYVVKIFFKSFILYKFSIFSLLNTVHLL